MTESDTAAAVFFYGLFMDTALLAEKGFRPQHSERALLRGYGLRIGQRASLVVAPDEKVHGLLMHLEAAQLEALYAGPGLEDYQAVAVSVELAGGRQLSARCYNLPVDRLQGRNVGYAQALYALAQALGFPQEYLEQIQEQAR